MQIDIYLGFTSCQWNCIFCRKWDSLAYFPRPTYTRDTDAYLFFHFSTEEEADTLFQRKFIGLTDINISWNDAISWKDLSKYIYKIRIHYPGINITLRISNTTVLPTDYIGLFERFEFSIYGHTEDLHNMIVGSEEAWNVLHTNITLFRDAHTLNKIFFQTIFLHENIWYLSDTITYIINTTHIDNPIKIVYPYFMPTKDIKSLPKKSEVLKKICIDIWPIIRKECCILVNFSVPQKLIPLFFGVSD